MELAEPEATASVLAEAGVLRAATFHIYILFNTHVMFARTVHIHLYLHKTTYIYMRRLSPIVLLACYWLLVICCLGPVAACMKSIRLHVRLQSGCDGLRACTVF